MEAVISLSNHPTADKIIEFIQANNPNIAIGTSSMKGITGPEREETINRQLSHFYNADEELALKVAQGPGIDFKP